MVSMLFYESLKTGHAYQGARGRGRCPPPIIQRGGGIDRTALVTTLKYRTVHFNEEPMALIVDRDF